MIENKKSESVFQITDEIKKRFDREVAKYPAGRQQSAVMACLSIIQQVNGWVSPQAEEVLAKYLEMPVMAVHEVTTFYNMYNQKPVGKFKLAVCTNAPCMFAGGTQALAHLVSHLGVDEYGTTSDGMFTVEPCECLGACGDAPVMLVNDRHMCSFMTNDKLDQLVEGLRTAED